MPSTPPRRDVQLQYPVSLNITISPAAAIRALEERRAAAADTGEKTDIQRCLRRSAITIFTHEALSDCYHARAQSEENLLPILLCMLHGQDAPAPRHTIRMAQLNQDLFLPFPYWDSLYLALVAEIRILHHDVLRDLKTAEPGSGKVMLHNFGIDGMQDNRPFPMVEFASQLEETWKVLMSVSLLGPLEKAVREQRLEDEYTAQTRNEHHSTRFEDVWNKQDSSCQFEMLNRFEGLPDPTTMSPTAIIDIIRRYHIPRLDRACEEQMYNERPLSAQHPVRRNAETDQNQADYFGQPASEEERPSSGHSADFPDFQASAYEPHCFCDEHCKCSIVCQYEVGRCSCKDASSQPSLHSFQQQQYEETVQQPDIAASTQPQQVLRAMSGRVANMQITDMPMPADSRTAQRVVPDATARNRQRADTAQSDLVYVPDIPTPPVLPYKKDAVPLEFYGRNSGQRYPKFHRNDSYSSSPGHSRGNSSGNIPSRKPLPSPLAAVSGSVLDANATKPLEDLTAIRKNEIFPPKSVRNFACPPNAAAIGTTYTQSFPVPAHGNRRVTENEFSSWDTSHVKTPTLTPMKPDTALPDNAELLRHSVDRPSQQLLGQDNAGHSSRRGKVIPPPSSLSQPTSGDELPDCIQPRPALRQRYVSAGGDTPLRDRPEITGFALPPAVDPGMSVGWEKFLQKLESVSPPRRDSAVASTRPSQETTSNPTSNRVSREAAEAGHNEKRQRTSSSVSTSTRIIKRLFSRQNSSAE